MHRLILGLFLLCLALPVKAADTDFNTWLQGMRQDAMTQGISAATLDRAFAGVQPIPRVIELDRSQPESKLTFQQYLDRVVPQARRDMARQRYLDNKDLLDNIGARYGVPPRYIVALWGIETNFGGNIGNFSVVAALTTLAYDGRRAAFFRKELINTLQIIQKDGVDPKTMIGSWAGAMGQSQFMPSSYLAYAVSYSGNGAPDIWNKPDDVFASIANYLSRVGWKADQRWGDTVRVPPGFDPALVGKDQRRTVGEWASLGVTMSDGRALPTTAPDSERRAALLQPGGSDGLSFLAYDNFNVILRWNNSSSFAVAVGYLADSVN
jgi:membrane-bound lytic murein transglycosylase B